VGESFETLLCARGITPETARKLASLARPAVRLSSRPLDDNRESPIGASRLGGTPDVSPGFVWPLWKGRPLSFLAQLDLSALASYPFCSVLPQRGVLAFFYDPDQETWGFDPNDRGSWLVHFEPDPAVLRRGVPPETATVQRTCALDTSEVETLPSVDSPAVGALELTAEERNVLWDVGEHIAEQSDAPADHQLLGLASPIQGDMQLECQLASNGVYCGDAAGYASSRARALEAGAGDWRLLMQIDSDDNAEMMWGDCGRLYFWMTEDALRQGAFAESWMVLQGS